MAQEISKDRETFGEIFLQDVKRRAAAFETDADRHIGREILQRLIDLIRAHPICAPGPHDDTGELGQSNLFRGLINRSGPDHRGGGHEAQFNIGQEIHDTPVVEDDALGIWCSDLNWLQRHCTLVARVHGSSPASNWFKIFSRSRELTGSFLSRSSSSYTACSNSAVVCGARGMPLTTNRLG